MPLKNLRIGNEAPKGYEPPHCNNGGIDEDGYDGMIGHPSEVLACQSAAGERKATWRELPQTRWQRCVVRSSGRNVLAHVPQSRAKGVAADLKTTFEVHRQQTAKALAKDFGERYRADFPKAVQTLERELEEALTFMAYPSSRPPLVRTTKTNEGGRHLPFGGERHEPFHDADAARQRRLVASSNPRALHLLRPKESFNRFPRYLAKKAAQPTWKRKCRLCRKVNCRQRFSFCPAHLLRKLENQKNRKALRRRKRSSPLTYFCYQCAEHLDLEHSYSASFTSGSRETSHTL